MVDQRGQIRVNGDDRKKTKQIMTEDRIRTFAPHKSRGPDRIYPVRFQTGLGITIKYLNEVFRIPLAMGHIPVP